MRPRYETDRDMRHEADVKTLIEKAWSCELEKTPPMHHFDFVAVRDRDVMGFIEYKRRKGNWGTYQDIMLSAKKLNGLIIWDPIPVYFVAQWDDVTVWAQLEKKHWANSRWGGRTAQQRDKWDVEIVGHIPNEDFEVLA